MEKVFKIENLDCANCALNVEKAIKCVDGVNNATVDFITQKLVLDVEEDKFDSILTEIVKVSKKS